MRIEILCLALPLLFLSLNCEGCRDEEREALVQIHSSMNSPDGTAFINWYGEDCCQWYGVECDASTSLVVKIFLHNLRREERSIENWHPNATLFAQFKGLQELSLPGNQIGGFVSPKALSKLKHLQKLDLQANSIADGTHLCWGNIPTLNFLDLSRNKLQGDIPKCLCESRSYQELILSHNQLNGSIDACFTSSTSLKHLDLSGNLFTGKFPSLLFHNLSSIEAFIISRNQFKDTVSFSIFANLSKLIHLDISYNWDLDIETESPTWSPTFDLNQLKLAGGNLNMRNGRKIPFFISTQYHLQFLDLSYNSLIGSVPPFLFYNVSSELWIRGNNLSGLFPRSEKNMSSQLTVLDISDNLLYGSHPADINSIFPELFHLNASWNNFAGSFLQSLGAIKPLRILDLSYNDFDGEIPHGIYNMTSLEYLKLSGNNMQGEAIPRNFSWCNLKWLFLDNNHFSGLTLDSLSKCSSLLMLGIHNNDLSIELSTNLPVLPQLRVLLLRGNRFRGKIPVHLCHMTRLHLLDLSQNDLSGDIPNCLDNITSWTEEPIGDGSHDQAYTLPASLEFYMKGTLYTYGENILAYLRGIDFSSNKFTGTVPHQIGNLRGMLGLNMSNNLLTGQIPASLTNLKSIESLDLSRNKFFGPLCPNLTGLLFLAAWNVSFNNLSGPVPQGRQFDTFAKDSYLGNPSLCGPPLVKKCDVLVEGRQSKLCSNMVTMSTMILCWAVLFFSEIIY